MQLHAPAVALLALLALCGAVQAAALCPPRQPELLAIEAECAQDDHTECSTTPAPTSEAAGEATATEAAAAAPTTEPPPTSTEGAPPVARRQRKRSCNYHLCVLKKLEVLDSSDMPDKTLLTNWIANNVTDEKQREKLQQRFTECVTSLKDIFGESSENSKSNEEETTDDKKNEETQPKKKSCVTAKKVISCLSKSVECPVLKF
ncbi:hypothetical protein R5R35_001029 [Gryllus longicercus]|uniref:Odorant binding protein n=1 Tax=Gryllus longicercus TaxID=2509291 RepID=A0AAN9V9Z1_9ORTH